MVPDRSELRRSAFFKEFLEPFGWQHLAAALYWRGEHVGSQIAIRRTAKQGDFSAQEVALLEAVHPHIETVLNRLLAYEEERARRRWLEAFTHHLPFALLFLNGEMTSLDVNQAGLEQCSRWNFGPAKARAYQPRAVFSPPAEVVQACAALKTEWLEHHSMGQPHLARIFHTQLDQTDFTEDTEPRPQSSQSGQGVWLCDLRSKLGALVCSIQW